MLFETKRDTFCRNLCKSVVHPGTLALEKKKIFLCFKEVLEVFRLIDLYGWSIVYNFAAIIKNLVTGKKQLFTF